MTDEFEAARALQSALDRAYRYLGRRDRTVAEVRRHLEARATPPGVIDSVVREFSEHGYLDDERYARRFAEDRRTLDSWGAERIEQRLRAVGIERELASRAARERPGEDDAGELGAAVALLRRRWPVPPSDDRERDRALGLLVRRGYELELAYDAIRALERDAA